ncbi:MAG: PAS domain S-box protein [Deltaproteobacteria bacterium]|nr:PAS domain S-box protein [Deltaproteobacteria bacterium]
MSAQNNREMEPERSILIEEAVENTNEAFVTIDEDHRVLFFNRAAEKLFGYSRDEVVGRDLNLILSSDCSVRHRRAVTRYLESKQAVRIGHASELMVSRKNGEQFPASISFSVSEIHGKSYFTAILQDLTERKALQEQLLKNERLAALGQVVAEITHEIKNPLISIGGFAQQLARKATDDASAKKLEIICRETSRLEKLLAELRELYHPGAQDFRPVDIRQLLADVIHLSNPGCSEKRVTIEYETGEEPVLVQGDKDKLTQVFLNLIQNSSEAMTHGGKITVQSRSTDDSVVITVSDEGPGVSEELLDKLFSPFVTTKKHGSGLGLAISKRIVEDHHGKILAKSAEGKGTQMIITLPLLDRK